MSKSAHAPQPQFRAWVVTLVYGMRDGPIHIGTAFAATEGEATAIVMDLFLRSHGHPEQPLVGTGAAELPAAWLRAALQAVETGKPGDVVYLVRAETEDAGPDPAA